MTKRYRIWNSSIIAPDATRHYDSPDEADVAFWAITQNPHTIRIRLYDDIDPDQPKLIRTWNQIEGTWEE